jgi:hypothetical protein
MRTELQRNLSACLQKSMGKEVDAESDAHETPRFISSLGTRTVVYQKSITEVIGRDRVFGE